MTTTRAFILAAGYGTRLRPITYTMPKPMVPLCNRPLIAWAVESLMAAGVRELIVNLHHLPEALEEFLSGGYAGRAVFHFSREAEILGTGGGIRRVRPLLAADSEFLVVNGDTVQFPPWEALRAARQKVQALAALTLRHPPAGDRFTPVYFDEGLVTGIGGTGRGSAMMFAGSHVVSTRIFDILPDREVSGIVEHAYIPMLESGRERLAGVSDDGLWFDVGTPQRYLGASRQLLAATVAGALHPVEGSRVEGDSLLHDSSSGHAVRSTVGARSRIEGDVTDSIIWDDCHVATGAVVEHCIVGHGVVLRAGSYRHAVIVRDDPAIPAELERQDGNVVSRFDG